ncbi:hypothetical protein V6N11_076924 [Hibiscus sabdariffa]|uniref:Uncharacterized protein n=1 Tax=Hibiscus sabdariffa TaxID=183260 RepID=A0ABR2TCG3_9ROSI
MSNTYNPAWRKHPNFTWQNQNNTLNPQSSTQQGYQNLSRPLNQPMQDYQQPSNYRTVEKTLNTFMTQISADMERIDQFIQKTDAFMDRTEMRIQNHEAALKSLENQVGQISKVFNSRPIGGFPSDTEVTKGVTHEQCKAISTRSGKVLEPPTKSKQGEVTVANPKHQSDAQICLPEAWHRGSQTNHSNTATGRSLVRTTRRKIEDILIRVDKFIFPVYLLILDYEADEHAPIIPGRPFLAAGRVLLDFENDELVLRVNDQQVKINIFKTMKRLVELEDWQMIEATTEFHLDTEIICLGREHIISLNDLNTDPDDT